MGNELKTVKIANPNIINENQPLDKQLIPLGSYTYPYIGLVEKYRLVSQNTKQASIFAKLHANTVSDDEVPLYQMHQQRMKLEHPNLIKYYAMTYETKLLVNTYETVWYFEALTYNLKDLVRENIKHMSLIREDELWRILYQCCSVFAYLEEKHLWHTYIQPDQIYIDDTNNVKVIERGLLRQLSGYAALINKTDARALLSPRLMEEYRNQNLNPVHDIEKSDVYSLGMTFLELLTLKDSFECYRFGLNPCIYGEKIQERIEEAAQHGYSQDLVNVVHNMLIEKEDVRPSFRVIYESEEMERHIVRIRSLQQFTGPLHPLTAPQQHLQQLQVSQLVYNEQPIQLQAQAQAPAPPPPQQKITQHQMQMVQKALHPPVHQQVHQQHYQVTEEVVPVIQQIIVPQKVQKIESPNKVVYVRQIGLSPEELAQYGLLKPEVNSPAAQLLVKQVQLTPEQLKEYAEMQSPKEAVVIPQAQLILQPQHIYLGQSEIRQQQVVQQFQQPPLQQYQLAASPPQNQPNPQHQHQQALFQQQQYLLQQQQQYLHQQQILQQSSHFQQTNQHYYNPPQMPPQQVVHHIQPEIYHYLPQEVIIHGQPQVIFQGGIPQNTPPPQTVPVSQQIMPVTGQNPDHPNYKQMNDQMKPFVIDDLKESWQINQKVNQALAMSRQAIEKFGQQQNQLQPTQ